MVSDLAFYLARQGCQVVVVTGRIRYEDAKPVYAPHEHLDGVEIHRVKTTGFGRFALPGRALDYLTFYLSAAWRLWRLVRPGDIIVAKTDPPFISLVAVPVACLRGARLVHWIQDLFPEIAITLGIKQLDGRMGTWLTRLRNRSFSRSKACVATGDRMAEHLATAGVDPSLIQVIHNWVDGDAIRPLAHSENRLRKEWGLDGKIVVGYSGNLGRVHEYETMLGAAELLKQESGIVFLILGDGARYREFQQACSSHDLTNIRFLPYQPSERLRESLGACDLHLIVLRPEMEGLVVPSKLYGVLAAGRPCCFIGDTGGEVARMIRRDAFGAAIKTGDAAALVRVIQRFASDQPYRERLGRNARAAFDAHYTRFEALSRWEAVLCEEKRKS